MTSANIRRYEFDKNWIRFARRSADADRINIARRQLLNFCNCRDLKGIDFLDIGCGSGLRSLAACQAGARRIHSFDYDADSVQATTMMR
jgi:2-polyprenyl-6-hydroxyphenyl methylase/3-demethylubiquinone-9 3-methyltransferase